MKKINWKEEHKHHLYYNTCPICKAKSMRKNSVNQKSSQVIIIKITYGSGFQKNYGNEMLVTLLKTFNSYFSKSHKENSFSITTKSV